MVTLLLSWRLVGPIPVELHAQELRVGYGLIAPEAGGYLPAASVVFGYRSNNTLISEAGIAASRPTRQACTYAEVRPYMDTGVAIANPNDSPAAVTMEVWRHDSNSYNSTTINIPGHQQIARFVGQTFGTAVLGLQGSLIVRSNQPVASVALRQRSGLRGNLYSASPMIDLDAPQAGRSMTFPHFATGGGYETQIILINPGVDPVSGKISFFRQDGSPAKVLYTETGYRSEYEYEIPSHGTANLTAATEGSQTISGYALANSSAGGVVGMAIFTQLSNFIPVSEASVPVTTSTHRFRVFINESAKRSTGLAIANPGNQQATVSVNLNAPSGPALASGTLTIPAGGQVAKFAREILNDIELEVPSILEVSSDVPVSPLSLRLTVNERGDTLLTTLPVADLEVRSLSGSAYFPQIAIGDGWNTEIIVMDSLAGDQRGTLSFFQQDGSTLLLANDSGTLPYKLSPGTGFRYMTLRGNLLGSGTVGTAGGTSLAPGDRKFIFPAGLFKSDTKLSLGLLTKDQAENVLQDSFASQKLTYVTGFAIDTGNAAYQKPPLLSFANASSLSAGAPVLVAQVLPDVNADDIPDMVLFDVAAVRGDRIESGSIDTLPGIRKDGSYLLLSSTQTIAIVTGQVTNADGSPAVGASVTCLEQPGIFSLTDSSGTYTLAVPVPESSAAGNSPDLYAGAVPFTLHLGAANPGLGQIGILERSIAPAPPPIRIPEPIVLRPDGKIKYLDTLCRNPDNDLLEKFKEWRDKAEEVIEKLKVDPIPYDPLSAALDCKTKSAQLAADLQPVLRPEQVNPALGNLTASKITLTKASMYKACISRNIQIANFEIGAIAGRPSAYSSKPGVADVTSNTISGNKAITTVQAVASGSGAEIRGGILLLKLGFKLDYSVEACGELKKCSVAVEVSDDLAMDIDRKLSPFLLGPAAVSVGDLSSCTPAPPPTISVRPTSLSFTDQAQQDPASQTLEIKNIGPQGSKLNYTVAISDSWIRVDGPLTALASGESASLSVLVSTSGLAAGTYRGALAIADPKASNSPVNVPITLTITSASRSLQTNPTSLSFSAQQGGANPGVKLLSVTSSGAALSWSGTTSASWLSMAPSSGTTPSGTNVAVNIAGLSSGVYNGNVTLTAAGASNTPLIIPVALTITAPPGNSLQVNPASFSFNAQQGLAGPPSQSLSITTTGSALNWNASTNASWLNVIPSSGATPSTASVSAVIAGLAPGTYNGMITINAAGANNSPVAIPVTLLITTTPPGPLTFTPPSTLPPGTIGKAYQFSFCQGARPNEACGGAFNPSTSPTGGAPPYHFQLGSGVGFPPTGLILDINGLLSGIPSVAGASTFSVCAVDLAASQVCKTVSLTIGGSSSFTGPFSGSASDSKTFPGSCVMKHTLSGTMTFTVSGSGTASDPYTGSVSGSGTDILTVASGTLCFGDTFTSPITGTVSGSSGRVQALATASGGGSLLTIEFTNGVISGNTLTGAIKVSNEFFDAPITGTMTLTRNQ